MVAKFRNPADEKVHLDLLQSFLKIKLKTLFLCFQSPELTILSSRKSVSHILCLIMKILTKKTPLYLSLPSPLAALFCLDHHPRPHKIREV